MCGIAGFVDLQNRIDAATVVGKMLPALALRGPDGEGVEQWPGVALGHRRLAIIDLSEAGRQPMLSADGKVGVTFNGCIYNFLELRKQLESSGHRFRSHCDTEVLIEGYLAWGIEKLVRKIEGMFAFAIWDARDQSLYVVRDRLGVKPLLYCAQDNKLAFASTLAALRAGGFGQQLNPTALLQFLEFGFVPDTSCIYAGITKLPPGHYLSWRNGEFQQHRYWSLSLNQDPKISFEDAVRETEGLLVEAVRKRLVADVPIGVLLSGGVDSGLVCWALKKLNVNIRSFTVGTPGDRDDETAAAKVTANYLGISNEVVTLSDESSAPLDQLNAAYSEPFASTSALGLLRVSKSVRSHATVLLTGDGGDDVFLGYSLFRYAWQAQQLAQRTPRLAASIIQAAEPALRAVPPFRRPASFLSYAVGGIGAMTRVREGLPYYEDFGVLGSHLEGEFLAERNQPASIEAARRLMDDRFQFHMQYHFLSEFMPKVDGATMYHALEARSPMLDHQFWEFGAKVPYAVRLRDGVQKAVLREIARRHLGPAVSNRPKLGFTIPAEQWLLNRWRADLDALGADSLAAKQGWFRQDGLAKSVSHAVSTNRAAVQLWRLVVFEHWLRNQQQGA